MATEKLKGEMEQNKNNPYIQVVGAFLLNHLNHYPKDATKIMAADKTIAKSLGEMRKAAEKKKVGNCAVLTDQEGFAVVLKYFGIDSGIELTPAAVLDPKPAIRPTPKTKSKVDFDVSLDDFL